MILEIGNWVKVKDDDEYYEILSIDNEAAQFMLSDITGHKYAAFKREIERVVTNEELYGYKKEKSNGKQKSTKKWKEGWRERINFKKDKRN